MSEKNNDKTNKKTLILSIIISLLIVGGAAGYLYWKISSSQIYTDNASIVAPTIDLAPQTAGVLQNIFVNVGDQVKADTVVAQVGNELVKAKIDGIITATQDNIGKIFSPGEAVVSMIDPTQLRVEALVDEDKGLSAVVVGQKVIFTVDTFGSKQYEGVVDEVSQSAHQGDIVFNISNQRQVKQFDVKVRFDINKYPELKNGMSAKVWISK
jgi:multidrug resistance efflux pump